MQENPLIEKIDAILPQTQCGQCGFPGCRPYAIAIAEGRADINQCPPGDEAGIRRLADLLGVLPKPLNTAHGIPKPRAVALIGEQDCIGCTLCIQACPVDAIVGAAKLMHTVIAAECTGCERCVVPCPVDCIRMIPCEEQDAGTVHAVAKKQQAAERARSRHQFRLQRLESEQRRQAEKLAQKTATAAASATDPRKAAIQAALARVKAARAGSIKA